MEGISHEINGRLCDNIKIYKLTVGDVEKSVKRLKLSKSDSAEGLSSDHIINGTHLLTVLLTSVFNCMTVHGVSPDSMINGTMIPIPKGNRKLLCCSDNYRVITLSSIFGKVFDCVCALSIAIVLYQTNPLLACCFYLYFLVCFLF